MSGAFNRRARQIVGRVREGKLESTTHTMMWETFIVIYYTLLLPYFSVTAHLHMLCTQTTQNIVVNEQ
jgi:hypothetical protein